eukprot:406074_1
MSPHLYSNNNSIWILFVLSLQLCIFHVISQCDPSNAQCSFIYHDSHCTMYSNGDYLEISDQEFNTIHGRCSSYWESEYGAPGASSRCTSTDKFIWPIGSCGCPTCGCPDDAFCCFDSTSSFNINNWDNHVFQTQCTDDQDMCSYSITAYNQTTVSCSDTTSLNRRLSLDVASSSSTILADNNNTACYTFVDSDNSTTLSCFCGDSECNAMSKIIAPELKQKRGCYVSDAFHSELFWSNYVYQDDTCEMCSIAMRQSQDGDRVDFACKTRSSCYTLLSEYDAYNDELSGCVMTSNTTKECCCDPSIDGHLCNKQFLTSSAGSDTRSYFGCWKAQFLTVSDSNWDAKAKRVNCSAELYQYCVIQSFGNDRYSSTCETKSNCDKIEGSVSQKRICCNETEFCNEPSIFQSSSATKNFSVTIVCVLIAFSLWSMSVF